MDKVINYITEFIITIQILIYFLYLNDKHLIFKFSKRLINKKLNFIKVYHLHLLKIIYFNKTIQMNIYKKCIYKIAALNFYFLDIFF